jgi:ribosomal protein L6P/L9E
MKRSIVLKGIDKELVLSKATAVKTNTNMIHLDELPDGTWRLIYNGNLIPDFSKIECLQIIREND